MKLLGHFRYHAYEVKFLGSDSNNFHVVRSDSTGTVAVDSFNDLSLARETFENAVKFCIDKTILSDVGAFHQDTAGLIQ